MTLTQNSILRLISNHAVLSLLPELLPFVEQAKAARQMIAKIGSCTSCRKKVEMSPVADATFKFIIGLPSDRIVLLKQALGVERGKLYTYLPQLNGKPGLVELK